MPQARSLAYLQLRIMLNWIKRSTRSVITWILVGSAAFMFVSGALLGGSAEPPDENGVGPIPSEYFEAGAVLMFLVTLVIGLWRGTGKPPKATAADVVFVLCSPIRSRVQFGYLMFRDIAGMLSILTLVALVSMLGPLMQALMTNPDRLSDVFGSPVIGIWLILLIGGTARFAVWIGTEQLIVRDAAAGHRARRFIRAGTAAAALGVLAYLFVPVIRGSHANAREAIEHAVDRVLILAGAPPFSWAADVLDGNGPTATALIGLAACASLLTAGALLAARDFAEPIAVTAERQTDARGQSIESGSDVQWSTLSQLGSSPRLRFSIRPFGRGPWALFWCSLTRWVRYQFAVAWISVVTLLVFGVTVAVLVRLGVIPFFWAWVLVLSMPIFSSFNMFLDELRKPFLFMTPGPAWKRLVAAGATSVLDGLISSVVLVLILIVSRARPVLESLTLLIVAAALAFLIQASVGLVQVLLPSWYSRKIRTGLTFGVNAVALTPALTAALIALVLSGPVAAVIIFVLVACASAAAILGLSVLFFDRLEMPV